MINFIKLIADPGAALLPEMTKTHDVVIMIIASLIGMFASVIFFIGGKKFFFDDSKDALIYIISGILLGVITSFVIKQL